MQLYINVLIRVCNRRLSDDNGLGRTEVDDIVTKLLRAKVRAQTRLEETRATRRRSRSLPRSTQGGRRKSRRR